MWSKYNKWGKERKEHFVSLLSTFPFFLPHFSVSKIPWKSFFTLKPHRNLWSHINNKGGNLWTYEIICQGHIERIIYKTCVLSGWKWYHSLTGGTQALLRETKSKVKIKLCNIGKVLHLLPVQGNWPRKWRKPTVRQDVYKGVSVGCTNS